MNGKTPELHGLSELPHVAPVSNVSNMGGVANLSGVPEIPASRWRNWIIAAILALLFHALLLLPRFPGLLAPSPTPPPRVDVRQVDPKKLETIRRQWNEREKQLLLNQDKSAPSAKEADPNARYMSDRNIRVEKEQRARRSVTVPKPGAPGAPAESTPPPQPKTAPPQTRNRPLPNLGALGVPLPAAPRKPAPSPWNESSHRSRALPRPQGGQEGGEQYVADQDLPAGSENLLNAQESIYYSFYARLYEAIGPVWQSRIRQASRQRHMQPGEYSTQLDVVLDRNGNLVAIHQLRSSGVEDFDQAAAIAWRLLGRFPNPPSGLLNSNGEVHTGWTFTVQVHQGFGVQSLPPERAY